MKPTEQPRLVLSTHYTRCGALHPMWGATPFTSRYTRCGALHPIRRGAMPTDRVQRHFQQAFSRTRNDTNYQPTHTTQALHPLRRATPDVGRCTRCGALHPMWGATPDQKRCNAHRSGAAPLSTSTFADAHYLPDPASAHLPPSPWTATHCGPNCHSLAVAIHGTFTGKLQT